MAQGDPPSLATAFLSSKGETSVWESKFRSIRSIAAACIGGVCAGLVVIALVAWGINGAVNTSFYPGSIYPRLCLVCVSAVFAVTTGISIAAGYQSSEWDNGFVAVAHIIALHFFAIASCALLAGAVGLAMSPIIRNVSYPHLVVSLDIVWLPILRIYMLHVLYELICTQRAVSAAAKGVPADSVARPYLIFGGHTPVILGIMSVLSYLCIAIARLMDSRTAAACLCCVSTLLLIPSWIESAKLASELESNALDPSIRIIGRITKVCRVDFYTPVLRIVSCQL
jgi:hypothetical protein